MNNFRYTPVIVLFLLLYSLFGNAQTKTVNEELRSHIESLMDNGLRFSDTFYIKDILPVADELADYYLQEKDYKHFFLAKQMKNYAISFFGDLNILQEARNLHHMADSLKYPLGKAIAHFSVGDVYLNTQMIDEALSEYQKALRVAKQTAGAEWMEINTLKLITPTLIDNGRFEEADKSLKEMRKFFKSNPDFNHFPLYIYESYYHIMLFNLVQLEDALKQAEACYHEQPFYYHEYLLKYMQSIHAQYLGNNKRSLELLSELLSHSNNTFNEKGNLGIYFRIATLYAQNNQPKEACKTYKMLNVVLDSISARNYTTQVNLHKIVYQIDELQIQNQRQWNYILVLIIVGAVFLTIVIVISLIHIRKANKQLKLSEERLIKARKTAEMSIKNKSLLLSNMSHEIRTPLTALSGFSGILADKNIDIDTQKQCYEIIEQNSELLLKLINDIIDMSNLEIGKMQFQIEEHEAVALCRNVIDTVEKIKRTNAVVLFESDFEELYIHTDHARFQQLLINLIINATKFTPEGSIVLSMKKQTDNMVLFSVTDTGCGIAPEKQDSIFNRFEKLNEQAEGSGLGLSICRLIIEQLKGQIWLDKSYTNGCRFCFTHPIKRKEGKV